MSTTLKHCGLPEGFQRSGFIEYISPALKARGIRTSAIVYLSKAFDNWTRDQDYEPDRICGFWHHVSCLAGKLTCTPRFVNSTEDHLQGKGMICRFTMANGARRSVRKNEEKGVLRSVWGINLAPIIELASTLIAETKAIHMYDDAMDICRKEINQVNRKIRQLQNDDAVAQAQEILPNGRSAIIKEMTELKEICEALKAVEIAFKTVVRLVKISDQQEKFE